VDVILAGSAFALATVLVGAMIWFTRRFDLMDVPNHRSSHSVPTPRGGGLGIVLTLLAFGPTIGAGASQWDRARRVWALALLSVAIIGMIDDRASVSVRWRFAVHLFAAALVAYLAREATPITFTGMMWLPFWVFWTVSAINVVNFMDGIDGLIASQTAIFALYLVGMSPGESIATRGALVLAVACLGFLTWNWPPARVFMGDVGSGPVGVAIVLCGLLAAFNGLSPVVAFFPLLPLFLDATLTLIARWRRGERLSQPHRSHLYQRMANGGLGHRRVTLMYGLAALIGAAVGLIGLRAASPWLELGTAVAFAIASAVVGLTLSGRYPLRP
jgi:Fuc2NAc and GlcNAc transferase